SICRAATDAGAELVGGQAQQGCFIAPGYLRNIAPANPGMEQEIFGPIATLSTFRTADEAIELANNTRYGLAASVWSESATVATDLAARIKAGVVWINAANLLDAAAPFGGYRESGYGREGGAAGMLDYLAAPEIKPAPKPASGQSDAGTGGAVPGDVGIDRTAKLYYGGAQKRPDGGAMYAVPGGLAPRGGRKDIRNAVEAATKAGKWAAMGGHARAQVLYYIAENLAVRADEFAARCGRPEVDAAIARAFYYAAWADKLDGRTVEAKPGHLVTVIPEPFGVIGIACPNVQPLAGFLSLVLPAIAMGNAVVALPAQNDPLAVIDLYQVLDTSDVPGGVVNIVTGARADLVPTLAGHEEVAAYWHGSGQDDLAMADRAAAGNLKPVWAVPSCDWTRSEAQGEVFLRQATRSKTIWLPYGALPAGSGSAAY
ncbi:MAG: aldehyde dehydrogenase family protein, partial [Paracoccus sp. (in: a-proteobacteria)]|nr:aldehyde dehydrogenase family protein [Paracoccus sp. (in: a-proteobacteria)]